MANDTPVIAPDEKDPELRKLYDDFAASGLIPLWTEIGDLMPLTPRPEAVPHVWQWDTLLPLARRSGDLVPVGRGGERRAIALANPGLPGRPYATPNLWAAIQYLGPREVAPAHRHSQGAFRFILEGEGVWTVVNDGAALQRFAERAQRGEVAYDEDALDAIMEWWSLTDRSWVCGTLPLRVDAAGVRCWMPRRSRSCSVLPRCVRSWRRW